jgi:hypothetical protein
MIKTKKTICLFAIVAGVMISITHIQAVANAGAFIEKGLSPRSAGMGMSQVAVVKGSDAVYWNPAGLGDKQKGTIQVMGTQAFETRYTSAQAIIPWNRLNIGFGYINANMGGIDETRLNIQTNRDEKTGKSLAYDANGYYLGTGIYLIKEVAVGLTGKVIQERAAGYSATGVGVDFGVLYKPLTWISGGLNIQNLIAPNMKWNTDSGNVDKIPTNVKIGLGVNIKEMVGSVDLNFRKNRPAKLNIGVDYFLHEILSLRVGLASSTLSLGTGLLLGDFEMGFSWMSPEIDEIEDIYRFSLGHRF